MLIPELILKFSLCCFDAFLSYDCPDENSHCNSLIGIHSGSLS